jgi:hypothetical protein
VSALNLREEQGGVVIPLRAKPRAGKNAVEGVREGVLLVSVRAAPADGEANAAVVATVAEALGCAKSSVRLVRGHKSRDKAVLVQGLEAAAILERLNRL